MPANLENSICQQIWKTQQCPQDWKRSVFIPIPKKGTAKDCSNYHKIVLISHASKVMLKFLQARLQQYMNFELPDIQVGFRKGRGNRDQIDNIDWIIISERVLERHHSSVQSQSCLPLCDPMNHITPGLPVHHQHLESTQTHVH